MKILQIPKISLFALVLFVALAVTSCKKDDPVVNNLLSKDAANLDAPELPAGDYEAGVSFRAADLTSHVGKKLTEITYYLKDTPSAASVKIYSGPNSVAPVSEYEVTIDQFTANAWNTHTLTLPMEIKADQDYWLVLKFKQIVTARVVGCDAGPAVIDGDWLWDAQDQSWLTFRERTTNVVNINWNIRGNLVE